MLRGIPDIIGPDLLAVLAEMGHGDSIVVADTFYPAKSKTDTGRVIYEKGVNSLELIDAILKIMPVDTEFGDHPIQYMVDDNDCSTEKIHEEVLGIILENGYSENIYHPIKRSRFYEVAQTSYATISTGEKSAYGCFIIYKGLN